MNFASIDLTSSQFHSDPYTVYAALREEPDPFFLERENAWIFTRYDDVAAMLKDPRISKEFRRPVPGPLDMSMLFQDPPAHQRLRGLVNQTFTRARVLALETRIAQIANERIDAVFPRRQMDFIADFALQLPVMVIAEMLGVPDSERETFHHWSDRYVNAGVKPPTEETIREQETSLMTLVGFFEDLIERRRAEPQADILSALIQAHDAGDRLSTTELIGTVILLLIAGHETTVNLLGSGLLCLLRRPDQFALLKQQPELMESAIDEILRFESPVQRGTFRIAAEPIPAGSVTMQPGAQVYALIGAANRDPAQFPDPDHFDITRTPNRHLAFGYGIHYCMGASLARAEARIGFEQLLSRLPDLRAAAAMPPWIPRPLLNGLEALGMDRPFRRTPKPEWRSNLMMRSLKSLPVCW